MALYSINYFIPQGLLFKDSNDHTLQFDPADLKECNGVMISRWRDGKIGVTLNFNDGSMIPIAFARHENGGPVDYKLLQHIQYRIQSERLEIINAAPVNITKYVSKNISKEETNVF